MGHGDPGKLGVDAFLQLNANGERHVNEDLTNDHFGSQIVRQKDCLIYQIFDAEWPNQLAAMQAGLGTQHAATPEMMGTIDEWTTAKGDTIEELVANLGVDDEVAQTMARRSSVTTSCAPRAATTTLARHPSACSPWRTRRSTRSPTRWVSSTTRTTPCAASSA